MPVTLDLLPKTYLWCTCGMSKNQPFCDGSHSKTEFKPLKFTISEMQGRKKEVTDGQRKYNQRHSWIF